MRLLVIAAESRAFASGEANRVMCSLSPIRQEGQL